MPRPVLGVAATLTGTATVTAQASAQAYLDAALAGVGGLSGALVDANAIPEPVFSSGRRMPLNVGIYDKPKWDEPTPLTRPVNIAATLAGKATASATIGATAEIDARLASGSIMSGGLTGAAQMAASIAGRSQGNATGHTVRNYRRQNEALLLLAA